MYRLFRKNGPAKRRIKVYAQSCLALLLVIGMQLTVLQPAYGQ